MIIFSSEFDHLRKDAINLLNKCDGSDRLIDFHDMPGVAHGYQADVMQQESKYFYQDLKKCYDKYINISEEVKDEGDDENNDLSKLHVVATP